MYLEANARLTDALQHLPSSTLLRLQLAQLHAVRGRRSQAAVLAAAAPAAAPHDADAHALALLSVQKSTAAAAVTSRAAAEEAAGLVEVLRCDPGALDTLFGTWSTYAMYTWWMHHSTPYTCG